MHAGSGTDPAKVPAKRSVPQRSFQEAIERIAGRKHCDMQRNTALCSVSGQQITSIHLGEDVANSSSSYEFLAWRLETSPPKSLGRGRVGSSPVLDTGNLAGSNPAAQTPFASLTNRVSSLTIRNIAALRANSRLRSSAEEHLASNQTVAGSNPAEGSSFASLTNRAKRTNTGEWCNWKHTCFAHRHSRFESELIHARLR